MALACIAIDAMGGDNAPRVNLRGAIQALELDPELNLLLVGNEALLRQGLMAHGGKESERLKIIHADEVISMEDHAAAVIRKKKKSSIHIGLQLVKEHKADAFISAGNSGAVMGVSLLTLGRLPQVDRPPIVVKLPTAEGFTIMLDAGANVDSKAHHLLQFAEMGEIYAREIEGIKKPRVGILANASEAHKGNELTREADELLKQSKLANYVGYVEGFDFFRGTADVLVCDGFVGNIILKTTEGLADTCFQWFRTQVKRDPIGLVGVLLMRKVLKNFKKKFDYQPYGAAPLLGIDGLVLISHGGSTEVAIRNGILNAKRAVEQGFMNIFRNEFGQREQAKDSAT